LPAWEPFLIGTNGIIFFTADKGARIYISYNANDNWTGSDFTYQKLSGALNWFLPLQKKWISGFRVETNFMFGDAPFYALPSLALTRAYLLSGSRDIQLPWLKQNNGLILVCDGVR
jgi:hypothetical protein